MKAFRTCGKAEKFEEKHQRTAGAGDITLPTHLANDL